MEDSLQAHLADQISRANVILFTGAGFSHGATSVNGSPVPSVEDLRDQLWPIAFPDEPLDTGSSLADVYECALATARNRTLEIMRRLLRVEGSSLPTSFETWFSVPWLRAYTVNVDDLDEVARQHFQLPRRLESVSALTDFSPPGSDAMYSIHLNGRIADLPGITFSAREYGLRTAHQDPWYQYLVADIASHTVVYVGATLQEPTLWQHIELRRSRGSRGREFRPRSYLVAPSVPVARGRMLSDLNVHWVQMGHEEFATQVLSQMGSSITRGHQALASQSARDHKSSSFIMVSGVDLRVPDDAPEFLLGRQPVWGDLASGFAATRDFEEILATDLKARKGIAIITGTAGSGKSITLMREALTLNASGKSVLWLDPDTELSAWEVRRALRERDADVVVIDDADIFGFSAGQLLKEVAEQNPEVLVLASMRATRFDFLGVPDVLNGINFFQLTVPPLEDSDIDALLSALEKANRLGRLAGMKPDERVRAFRDRAGRQLLVAMIEATSGDRFEAKIDKECADLSAELGLVYATIALAHHFHGSTTREEVLLAVADPTNAALNRIDSLIRQRLVTDDSGLLRIRHRVIADRTVLHYAKSGRLVDPVRGLFFAMATKTQLQSERRTRESSLLIRLLNHDWLYRTIGLTGARSAYDEIEDILRRDYHYWLQRGSLEVEQGDLNSAQNFLDQAFSLAPDDYKVQTEWAYMSLRKACEISPSEAAHEKANRAFEELDDAISKRGTSDPYPYHVFGSQGLAWVNRSGYGLDEAKRFLTRVRNVVAEGKDRHPQNRELRQLHSDVEKAYLMLAVNGGEPGPPKSST